MEIGQSAGKSFAYLLGVYLGDGCVTKLRGAVAFRLNTIDIEFAEATRQVLRELSDNLVSIYAHAVKRSSKPNHSLYCGDKAICNKLRTDTDEKRRIPAYVMGASRDEKLAFIGGLMDSEGFVARKTATACRRTNRDYYMGFKSCDVWVPEFIKLLESVGIRIGKIGVEPPRQEGYKTPTRFTIKMKSWVDSGAKFMILRKQERVEEWSSAGAYENRAKRPRRLTSETTRQTAPGLMI